MSTGRENGLNAKNTRTQTTLPVVLQVKVHQAVVPIQSLRDRNAPRRTQPVPLQVQQRQGLVPNQGVPEPGANRGKRAPLPQSVVPGIEEGEVGVLCQRGGEVQPAPPSYPVVVEVQALQLPIPAELARDGRSCGVVEQVVLDAEAGERPVLADRGCKGCAALGAQAIRAEVEEAQGLVEGERGVDRGRPVSFRFVGLRSEERSYTVVAQVQM